MPSFRSPITQRRDSLSRPRRSITNRRLPNCQLLGRMSKCLVEYGVGDLWGQALRRLHLLRFPFLGAVLPLRKCSGGLPGRPQTRNRLRKSKYFVVQRCPPGLRERWKMPRRYTLLRTLMWEPLSRRPWRAHLPAAPVRRQLRDSSAANRGEIPAGMHLWYY